MKKTTRKSINNVSYAEDLMQLSVENNVPIIVAIQTNRTSARDSNCEVSNDTLELDTIRNSDGILHNASRTISVS